MYLPLPCVDHAPGKAALETTLEILDSHATVLAIGPGIGTSEETVWLVGELLKKSPVPMVVDADALNALAGRTNLIKKATCEVVLTPHPGEFARMTAIKKSTIASDQIGSAQLLAKKSGAVTLLKGAPTIIANAQADVYINPTGNSGLATAGSGDVLTGIIAGLMASGASAENAAIAGAYLHGLSADIVETDASGRALIASDLLDALPEAIADIEAEGP